MALVSHGDLAAVGSADQGTSFLARAQAVLGVWQRRIRERLELARMNDRELLDMGISKVDALVEYKKPFWRA